MRSDDESSPYDVDQVLVETLATKFKRDEADQTVQEPQPKRREKLKQQAGGLSDEMARRGSNIVDEYVAVEELHAFGAKEMGPLLEDEGLMLKLCSAKGVVFTVDMEKLAGCLPLHLMACVASSGSEPRLRYWLRSVRLLHTLSTLAHDSPKLSQVLLQDVKLRMQILDLVTYMLVVLANMEQEGRGGGFVAVLHTASVACSLYLLMAFISHDWLDVAHVLLAHPKVDIFMDAAFDVVKRDIVLLQVKLRSLSTKLSAKKTTFELAERVAQVTAIQCEASLQVLQHLCVTPNFRDQVLGHKELCKNGGILKLVLAVLRLQLPPLFSTSKPLIATFSRCKAKALVMMLKFCESEQCSFLDEVAAEPDAMQLAVQVAHEVLLLVKGALLEDPRRIEDVEEEKKNPMGLMHITALRLADIFSDDSNFRNLVMDLLAPDLASVLAVFPTKFQERWCGGPIARQLAVGEQDASLIFDPFEAAGEAMAAAAKVNGPAVFVQEEPSHPPDFQIIPLAATAHQTRAALLVKLFANFYCFNAEVCPADEKDRFMDTFLRCLQEGPLDSAHPLFFYTVERTAVRICENLHTLYDYVLTLTADGVVDDDLVLVSDFAEALHHQICPSSSSAADAPLSDFIHEGHEQKLLQLKNKWEQSERWQGLEQLRQSSHGEVAATEVAVEASNESEKTEVDVQHQVEEAPHTSEGEATGPQAPAESTPTKSASNRLELEDVEEEHESVRDEPTTTTQSTLHMQVTPKAEMQPDEETETAEALQQPNEETETAEALQQPVSVKVEEVESGSVNNFVEREDGGRGAGEQESIGLGGAVNNFAGAAMVTPPVAATRRTSRDRKPYSSEHGDESQPKKRKRNIMNDTQVGMMEEALRFEPEMQRSQQAMKDWTDRLNNVGPEVTFQQLKNWLNNRKARIARLERDKNRQSGEGEEMLSTRPEKSRRSVASDDMDSPAEASPRRNEDVDMDHEHQVDLKFSLHSASRTPSNAAAAAAAADGGNEVHNSGKSSKWKVGDAVSLRGNDDAEMALGTVTQVDGSWQRCRNLEDDKLCVVEVAELKVEKSTKLPWFPTAGSQSFEEAETLGGVSRVPWDVDHMTYSTLRATQLASVSTPPPPPLVNGGAKQHLHS